MGARRHVTVTRGGGRRLRDDRDADRARGFSTDWSGSSAAHSEPTPAYAKAREALVESLRARAGTPGDPAASARTILEIVDAAEPPLRAFFGVGPLQIAKADYDSRIATWEKWNETSITARG